jgi:Uma2 family endonuclease
MAVGTASAVPLRRRFNRDEFYQMLDLGWFAGQRVELIDGEVLVMASQKNFHAAGVQLTVDAIRVAFGPGFWVRIQASLDLTPLSVPDPDVAVVPGNPRGASASNPTSALLIVEVSDATLRYDRGRKASLYAAAGIADYWVLDLKARRLEVRRRPVPDVRRRFGFRYADRTVLAESDRASPLAAPQASVAVADLLP